MGRPKFDVRISLKRRGGPTHRIELRRLLTGEWQVFRNGKRSNKMPLATSSEIAAAIRRWLKVQ